MVSKLSANGVAGFILANGTLSGDGQEKAIRKKLIENRLVEAILLLPRNMFYTTDISVTLWIINKNRKAHTVKHGNLIRHYRDREDEILFMDLRQWGESFEKKYIQFSDEDRVRITNTFHTWQEERAADEYEDVPEYCYSASIEEVRARDYSLVPSKYIAFVNRDENIDFDEKMSALRQASLRSPERFWDIRVPKIDSIFDNSLVPRTSWSPGVPPQHRKLVAATHRSPI